MGKINAEWHNAHKMPTNPTEQQRAEWHYGHALNCSCRAVTPWVASLVEDQAETLPPDAPGLAGTK